MIATKTSGPTVNRTRDVQACRQILCSYGSSTRDRLIKLNVLRFLICHVAEIMAQTFVSKSDLFPTQQAWTTTQCHLGNAIAFLWTLILFRFLQFYYVLSFDSACVNSSQFSYICCIDLRTWNPTGAKMLSKSKRDNLQIMLLVDMICPNITPDATMETLFLYTLILLGVGVILATAFSLLYRKVQENTKVESTELDRCGTR